MKPVSHLSNRRELFLNNPTKGLWTLAIPIMVGMSVHTMYNIVDMFYIGRVSSAALAAISFNMPLFFFVIALMIGIGSGITALLARFIGAKDKTNAELTAMHGILIGLVISLLLSMVGTFYGMHLLKNIGTPENLTSLAFSYLEILSLGVPFIVLSSCFNAILSGTGDTKISMYIIGSGTLLNIGLDPVFIFVLDMGLKGAALATLISQATAFSVFAYLIFIKKHFFIEFHWKYFSFKSKIIRQIFRIGLPASASLLIMAFGGLLYNKILVSYSAGAVAAYQIASRIDMFVFLPIIAISSSLVTLVGMFLGANEISKVKFIISYGMFRAVFITSIGALLVYLFAPHISAFFTNDITIRNVAIKYFRTVAFIYPLIAVAHTSGRSLQGLGKGIPILVITSIRIVFVSAPLAVYFTFILGKPIEWVWYAMVISVIISAVTAFIWIRVYLKKISPFTGFRKQGTENLTPGL